MDTGNLKSVRSHRRCQWNTESMCVVCIYTCVCWDYILVQWVGKLSSSKLNICVLSDPSILILVIGIKKCIHAYVSKWMFKNMHNSMISISWVENKHRVDFNIYWYKHIWEHYTAMQINEPLKHPTTCMNLTKKILCKNSQTKNSTYWMILLL